MGNTCKYYKQQKRISYDSGITWTYLDEYRQGELYESNSSDCGGGTTMYRWVNLDPSTEYYCDECSPLEIKFSATYSSGQTYYVLCGNSTELTVNETKPSGYEASGMTSAEIGSCATSIGEQAFFDCSSLSSVTIPDSVTSIGEYAFVRCSGLTSVNIPSGVTSINFSTFYGCRGLTSVNIPSGVTTIDAGAFNSCTSLTNIDIPNGVTTIGNGAFADCSGLTSCTIGSGVTYINAQAFNGCSSLTSITVLAPTPPTIGYNTFNNTNNCPIYVPCASVDTYKSAWSDYANRIQGIPPCEEPTPTGATKFSATYSGGQTYSAACDSSTELTSGETKPSGYEASAMTSAVAGSCVTSIGDYAFGSYSLDEVCTALSSITIPASVTSIGDNAFANCSGLTSVVIPSGVTSIGGGCFYGCTSLTSITVNATTPPTLSFGWEFDNTNNCPIYVPTSSVSAYQTAWSTYASRIQAIP